MPMEAESPTTHVTNAAKICLLYDICLSRWEGSREEKAYQFNITNSFLRQYFHIGVNIIGQDKVCYPFTITNLLVLQTDNLLQIAVSCVTP